MSTATDVKLGSMVEYTDTRDHLKAALVVGTPASTGGHIPEGQINLMVFSPLSGSSYFRSATWDEAKGTFINSRAV